MIPLIPVFLALMIFLCPQEIRAGMTGATYRSKSSVLSGGGSPMQSATYKSDSSMGQAGAIGIAGSAGYVINAGFWLAAFLELICNDCRRCER
jgi:hypothetical protein